MELSLNAFTVIAMPFARLICVHTCYSHLRVNDSGNDDYRWNLQISLHDSRLRDRIARAHYIRERKRYVFISKFISVLQSLFVTCHLVKIFVTFIGLVILVILLAAFSRKSGSGSA